MATNPPMGVRCLVLAAVALAACTARAGSSSVGASSRQSGHLPPAQASHSVPTAAGAIAGHRFVRPFDVDGGGLRVAPPSDSQGLVSLARAAEVVRDAMTYDQGAFQPSGLGLGSVTITPGLTQGLPTYQDRLAWVAVIGPQVAISCPLIASGEDSASPPAFKVLVMDARSGMATLVYRSRGTGPCGGPVSGPGVTRAMEIVSIPWVAVGDGPPTSIPMPPGVTVPSLGYDWIIRYTLPACAEVFDSPGVFASDPDHPDLFMDVQRPIDPPAHCPPARSVTTSFGPERVPIRQVLHAPLGVTSPQ